MKCFKNIIKFTFFEKNLSTEEGGEPKCRTVKKDTIEVQKREASSLDKDVAEKLKRKRPQAKDIQEVKYRGLNNELNFLQY